MIVKEFYETRVDGVNLYRSYSDNGVHIRKVGTEEVYSEAVDVENAPYEYEETDIPIEDVSGEATEQDYINALAELGVTDEENNA